MNQKSEQFKSYKPGRYAAIDIGTVTARLLVADVAADGAITELHRDTAICNLGVGVDKTGLLDPAAIARVEEVVGRFVRTIDELQPADGGPAASNGEAAANDDADADGGDADAAGADSSDGRIVVTANATSASRDAKNSGDFVAVLAKLGVELSVIPGQKEAGLSFAGATSAFPGERVVVLDVGGGSSEIIAGQAGGAPVHAHSFNIGCRRVTERYLHDDPPAPEQLADAAAWIAEEMHDYLAALVSDGFSGKPGDVSPDGWVSPRFDKAADAGSVLDAAAAPSNFAEAADAAGAGASPCRIVAVAGTATSAVSMRERMEVYDSSRVHGAVVTCDDIDELLARLAAMTLEERKQVVGLDPGRAPVIVAGLLILQQIMRGLDASSFTVSERDILHGIILDAAAQ